MICRDHKEFHEQRAIGPKHEEAIVYLLMDTQFIIRTRGCSPKPCFETSGETAKKCETRTNKKARITKSNVLKDPNPVKNIPKVIYKDKYFA